MFKIRIQGEKVDNALKQIILNLIVKNNVCIL